MNRLTPDQYEAIRATVRENGALALAAHNAGISLTRLKAILATDEDLRNEIDDCLAQHQDMLYVTALQRATVGKSDTLLVKLLEARVDGFTKETRTPAHLKGKPTGLRLRTFDEEGNDAGATDVEPKKPTETLLIGLHQGL